jgi:asparagine synthetase B (glutamine-hydrolysing)
MSGMVVIIAHDRQDAVTDAEIEALAGVYSAMSGLAHAHAVDAGSFARLIKFDVAGDERPGIEVVDIGWATSIGVLHGPRTLIGADLSSLDGPFALVTYDSRAGRLVVATDPFGLQPLYMSERPGRTYIASSALALARYLDASPDRLGLTVMLCCGTQYGTISNWVGIERLSPATAIAFTASGREQTTYWMPEVDEEVARLSFSAAVDRAIDVLGDAFRYTYAGRPRMWADLTGGFDSRLLTLLFTRAGLDFRANTVGAVHSRDVRIARTVARVAGWGWRRFDLPDGWDNTASAYVANALAWSDGRLPALPLAEVLHVHEQQGAVYESHVSGGGGEILGGQSWNLQFFRAGRSNSVNYDNLIRTGAFADGYQSILAGSDIRAAHAYLLNQMRAHAHPYRSALNTIQMDVLLARRRISWDGMFAASSSRFLKSEMPFMLKAAFGIAFSVDQRHRSNRHFMRAMIERLNPRIAAIPTTSGGSALPWRPANLHHAVPYYARTARLAVWKVSMKARMRPLLAPAHTEHAATSAARRLLLRELSLTPATMLSAPFYKPGALEVILRRAVQPDFKDASLLDRILTVELAMRATQATA